MPYLLHLLGIKERAGAVAGLSAETLKARTFSALEQMAVRSSHRQPLAITIDDLHWIGHRGA